jgi:subtilase family serine protease
LAGCPKGKIMKKIENAAKAWSKGRRGDVKARARRAVVEAVEGRVMLSASVLQQQALETVSASDRMFAHTTFEVDPMAGTGAGPAVNFGTPSKASLTPAQIRQAYGYNFALPGGGSATGAGETIAIVDAYHDPNIQSDLHTFDQQYFGGVDPTFTQVNLGTSTNTDSSGGWELEESIDVEWAHAMAPQANIILVEATSNLTTNLLTAVDKAVSLGANVVSMSWGAGESNGETANDSHFANSNITFVASSGDSGAPSQYPAVSPYVVSVGGTSLTLDVNSNISAETGWPSSGGGISAYEPRPSYQPTTYSNGRTTGIPLTNRGEPDVAYDADLNSGIAVYDSFPHTSYNSNTPITGWVRCSGTSCGAPQWAAIIALADQIRAGSGAGQLSSTSVLNALYSNTADFRDITSGTSTGSPNYTAGSGYDLVTGLGSPQVPLLVTSLVGPIAAAPATPPALQVIPADGSVSVNWSGSLGASGYNLYRSTDGVTFNFDSTVAGTSFVDSGLTDGANYSYQVTVFNSTGESAPSSVVAATPQVAPATPTQLTAAGSSSSMAINLQWTAGTGDPQYLIKRATSAAGPFAIVAQVSSTSYLDTDVRNYGTTYYYRVSAVTSAGQQSADSNQASALTLPEPPVNLTATAGNVQIALSWSASYNATSYNILRATTSGGPYVLVASGVTSTSFTDTKVTVGTTYYYVVQAVDATGPSAYSNQASATAKHGK